MNYIHPVTQSLIAAYLDDEWPSMAAVVDYGLVSQEHYEAFYYAVREGKVTAAQLDEAMMSGGPALTKLARSLQHNPHKNIVFDTPYDHMQPSEDDDDILASDEAAAEGSAGSFDDLRKELGFD